ncbi:MAG: type II 3-dehydroquinate dehydratase [Hyphomicrobiales bacterium]
MTATIYILNGPNLNLLGTREPDVYGATTLADIEKACRAAAVRHTLDVEFRQSNSEGELVDWIQEAGRSAAGLIVNAGAYTHTSVALFDALKATDIPIVEVHLSNIFAREPFRHHSYVSPAATGVICGLGAVGYELAIDAVGSIVAKGGT